MIMTHEQKNFFHNLKPGTLILTSQAKDPQLLIQAAKDYVDSGGLLAISDDWSKIVKQHPFPDTNSPTKKNN
ncbi:hypothetical protein D9M68_764030 [compost metagenome]